MSYEPGEIVDVQIRGVRVMQGRNNKYVSIHTSVGRIDMPPEAVVTRVAPEHWPPTHNDVWDDGQRLNWVAHRTDDGKLHLYSALGCMSPDEFLREHPKLSLVHRKTASEGASWTS